MRQPDRGRQAAEPAADHDNALIAAIAACSH
jgi:hypothetical protein